MAVLVQDHATLAQARQALVEPVGVVMTMGALHEGHATLMQVARQRCASVIVTIFVNPLQFGPNEDLDRYPRTLAADMKLCEREGVEAVFAPDTEVMYPTGRPAVTLHPGPLASKLEGMVRPGHFTGVLTVVAKLLHFTRPQVTFFGEKDYQQLALIRQMVTDLAFDVEIAPVPIVRETDGLALSSRNAFLSPEEREQALALSAALRAGAACGGQGPAAVVGAARQVLDNAVIVPDYLALTSADLGPAPKKGEARLLVAAPIGSTRLIDNTPVMLG